MSHYIPIVIGLIILAYVLFKQRSNSKRLDVVAPKKTPDGKKIKYVPEHKEEVVIPAHTKIEGEDRNVRPNGSVEKAKEVHPHDEHPQTVVEKEQRHDK